MSQNPMIPFLAGWLLSALHSHKAEVMLIRDVRPTPEADGFSVTFGSGLVLVVRISEEAGA